MTKLQVNASSGPDTDSIRENTIVQFSYGFMYVWVDDH